jgi:hypothetical protein
LPAERALLLRLGVAAVRQRAGRPADRGERPPPAPAESRPACSDALAAIVSDLCRARELPLLAEALARMDQRDQRLPAVCLVDLAELKQPALLPAAARVAGERGRWLAGHNPDWSWLLGGDSVPSLQERKEIWLQGSLPARLAAVRATRAEDPGEGRGWIEAVWKEEKAAVREEILQELSAGLCAADEPFLDRALADRALPVRAAAARLLARLPGSALARRMTERADAILDGREIAPPATFPPGWAQDGLLEKPPAGTGGKAFWIAQILALVDPEHWVARLGAGPDRLVATAAKSDWAEALLGGWLEAATLFRSPRWASALARAGGELSTLAPRLFPLLAREEAEALVLDRMSGGAALQPLIAALPAPWSARFGQAFLQAAGRGLAAASWQEALAWRGCLDRAATALPADCFAQALAFAAAPREDPAARSLRAAVDDFHATITIRQRIHQETPP